MEFLGSLEKKASERDEMERKKQGWPPELQLKMKIILLDSDVERLRVIAQYISKVFD